MLKYPVFSEVLCFLGCYENPTNCTGFSSGHRHILASKDKLVFWLPVRYPGVSPSLVAGSWIFAGESWTSTGLKRHLSSSQPVQQMLCASKQRNTPCLHLACSK